MPIHSIGGTVAKSGGLCPYLLAAHPRLPTRNPHIVRSHILHIVYTTLS